MVAVVLDGLVGFRLLVYGVCCLFSLRESLSVNVLSVSHGTGISVRFNGIFEHQVIGVDELTANVNAHIGRGLICTNHVTFGRGDGGVRFSILVINDSLQRLGCRLIIGYVHVRAVRRLSSGFLGSGIIRLRGLLLCICRFQLVDDIAVNDGRVGRLVHGVVDKHVADIEVIVDLRVNGFERIVDFFGHAHVRLLKRRTAARRGQLLATTMQHAGLT